MNEVVIEQQDQLGFKNFYADFQVKEFDDESKILTFRGTTEDVDRSGDIVVADGGDFANFSRNPLFLWAHDHSGATLPIGKAISVNKISGVGADFTIQFDSKDPFAMEVYRKYKEGYLHAVSIGFIAHKAERRTDEAGDPVWPPAFKYLEWELLELSGVPIPANPNALRNAYQKFLDYMSYATTKDQGPEEVLDELLQSGRTEEVNHEVADCEECAKKTAVIEEMQAELDAMKAAEAAREAKEVETRAAEEAEAEKLAAFRAQVAALGLDENEVVELLSQNADTVEEVDPTEQIARFIDERLQYLAGKAWK